MASNGIPSIATIQGLDVAVRHAASQGNRAAAGHARVHRKPPDNKLHSATLALRLALRQPLVAERGNRSACYRITKRAMDLVGALVLLGLLSPLMAATFLVLLVTTRGRPLFVQERLGLRGLPFPMFKFRTMYLDAERRQHEVRNEQSGPVFKNRRDPRVTRIGRILRALSIDELPQLFNVLAGHMSLVGPRPPVAKEVARYEPWQLERLSVKPGLTCLWQVSGRCEIGFEDWVRMDLWYVEHQSLWTDLKLLWKTPASVLSRRGAY
jgi:lipopolysaccharide/colanic/teichoic acid biosynthesis glycosyltransferase